MARIVIVDDHPITREGLAIRIGCEPDLEVCGEAADVAEALRVIRDGHEVQRPRKLHELAAWTSQRLTPGETVGVFDGCGRAEQDRVPRSLRQVRERRAHLDFEVFGEAFQRLLIVRRGGFRPGGNRIF